MLAPHNTATTSGAAVAGAPSRCTRGNGATSIVESNSPTVNWHANHGKQRARGTFAPEASGTTGMSPAGRGSTGRSAWRGGSGRCAGSAGIERSAVRGSWSDRESAGIALDCDGSAGRDGSGDSSESPDRDGSASPSRSGDNTGAADPGGSAGGGGSGSRGRRGGAGVAERRRGTSRAAAQQAMAMAVSGVSGPSKANPPTMAGPVTRMPSRSIASTATARGSRASFTVVARSERKPPERPPPMAPGRATSAINARKLGCETGAVPARAPGWETGAVSTGTPGEGIEEVPADVLAQAAMAKAARLSATSSSEMRRPRAGPMRSSRRPTGRAPAVSATTYTAIITPPRRYEPVMDVASPVNANGAIAPGSRASCTPADQRQYAR